MIDIYLAGTVRGKARQRITKSGHNYMDKKTELYEAGLRIAAQEAMAGRPPLEGPVGVRIEAVFAIPESYSKTRRQRCMSGDELPTKKPDWDNIAKLTDALNGVVWNDDVQIVMARVIKRYGRAPGLSISVFDPS